MKSAKHSPWSHHGQGRSDIAPPWVSINIQHSTFNINSSRGATALYAIPIAWGAALYATSPLLLKPKEGNRITIESPRARGSKIESLPSLGLRQPAAALNSQPAGKDSPPSGPPTACPLWLLTLSSNRGLYREGGSPSARQCAAHDQEVPRGEEWDTPPGTLEETIGYGPSKEMQEEWNREQQEN
jgi:hypothetical protein